MADNLDWYMARHRGVKVMVWAHNYHIAITPNPNEPALGRHLKDRHGAAYVSVGFVLGSGAYRALDARSVPPGRAPRFATFAFGHPPAGSFNALMAATLERRRERRLRRGALSRVGSALFAIVRHRQPPERRRSHQA